MTDWFDAAGGSNPVRVLSVVGASVTDTLLDFVQSGAMVTLATTSDGGALGVTITVDGRWRREYFRDADDLERWLEEGTKAILAACEARLASSARRRRQRP